MTVVEFETRVAGSLPPEVVEELKHLRVVSQSTETALQGPVVDQAALVGIINRLQGLGIELRGVRQLASGLPASTGTHRVDRHGHHSARPGGPPGPAGGAGPPAEEPGTP